MNKHFASVLGLAVALATASSLSAQTAIPQGWHLLDHSQKGFYGISVDKAYEFAKQKNLKSTPVIVAVIDSGVDTLHEDLTSVLWHNAKEIPNNGIDDDRNGYTDDYYGWNFLGNKEGANVEKDSYEAARVYHAYKDKWENKNVDVDAMNAADRKLYQTWLRAKMDVRKDHNPMMMMQLKAMQKGMTGGDSIIRKGIGKETYNCIDLEKYTPQQEDAKKMKMIMTSICQGNDNNEITNTELINELNNELTKMEMAEISPIPYRQKVVGDNYADFGDKYYGNSNVMVSNDAALHGTHVSGIIAATRNNKKGMDGIADNVKIMTIRAVPDGDEHDKDIALAIRYAVDNGARVINMSFGKSFSPEKKWVDEAVKYAESKNVLLVHAAGNEGKNLDSSYNFPTGLYEDDKRAANWITVGANGPMNDSVHSLTADFSNYGKKEVDVFAPGVAIYSTVPGGNTYRNLQGTSMASPVVAGVAALILQYFPNLSADQVKYAIEQSAVDPREDVPVPGTEETAKMKAISKTGGIVNAYEALKLASTLKPALKKAF